ncbi:MAG TPA: AAC(3) family N-acetyltransferase [Myxococcales bacterium]|nr:AAC(3) family N-acetyltransferase [Myxococcales bacterium]
MASAGDIERQLIEMGVRRGGVLLVHTSYRAVRPVDGGPLGLIEVLRRTLGPAGTLVMPTITDGETVFDPRSTPSSQMGITAELFWRQPGVVRSGHPGGSFAACGPLAERLCAPQPLEPPHGLESPPGRVYELSGQVLLLGVEHSESTLLHVAESLAKVPYFVEHPCLVEVDGAAQQRMVRETDHCCRGFTRMDAWLAERGLQREGRVGNARAKLVAARDEVDVAVGQLARDPLVFLCAPDAGCDECAAARASLPPSQRPLLRH